MFNGRILVSSFLCVVCALPLAGSKDAYHDNSNACKFTTISTLQHDEEGGETKPSNFYQILPTHNSSWRHTKTWWVHVISRYVSIGSHAGGGEGERLKHVNEFLCAFVLFSRARLQEAFFCWSSHQVIENQRTSKCEVLFGLACCMSQVTLI